MENSNWKDVKLGDIAEVKSGKRVPKGKLLVDYETAHPYIRITDLGNKWIKKNGLLFVRPEDQLQISRYIVNKGDVILSIVGSIGIVARISDELDKANLTENCVKLLVSNDEIIDDFLYYFLTSSIGQEEIRKRNVGSTQPKLPIYNIKSIEIQLPPLPEQKAIASVLSSLDDKIDLLHQQNQTLEALAETLFRQWFIERCPEPVEGEAKEDWPIYKFKDIVKHVKPGTNFQPKRVNNGIPFLNVKNLNNGFIDLQNNTFITQEEYERVHKNWKPEVGDVLISRIGTLGLVATILERDLPIAVHYNMINLKPKLIGTEFLYFFLKSNHFQEEYFSRARQSVQEYLAIEDVEEIEVKLPLEFESFTLKEQQFIEFYNKIKNNFIQIQTQHPTSNIQHPTSNIQHLTSNIQHLTSNT
jgi:type I restriction enzyme S subunit